MLPEYVVKNLALCLLFLFAAYLITSPHCIYMVHDPFSDPPPLGVAPLLPLLFSCPLSLLGMLLCWVTVPSSFCSLSSEKSETSDLCPTQFWAHSRHILWSSEINRFFRGIVGAVHVPFTSGPCCFVLYTTAPRMAMTWCPGQSHFGACGVTCRSSSKFLQGLEDSEAEMRKNWSSGPEDKRGKQKS